MKRLFWALFALAWVAPGASAGVTYTWEQQSPSIDGYVISGTLTFSDEAAHRGVATGFQQGDHYCATQFDLTDVAFTISGNVSLDFHQDLTDDCSLLEGNPDIPWSLTGWKYDFELTPVLSGMFIIHLYAERSIQLSGDQTWGVDLIGADNYMSLHCPPGSTSTYGDPCTGLSGRWVRTSGSVPTPSAVVLIGFGLFGLLCVGRTTVPTRPSIWPVSKTLLNFTE